MFVQFGKVFLFVIESFIFASERVFPALTSKSLFWGIFVYFWGLEFGFLGSYQCLASSAFETQSQSISESTSSGIQSLSISFL